MIIGRAFGIYLGISIAFFASAVSAETFPDFMGKQLGEAEFLATKSNFKIVVQKIDSVETRDKVLVQIPAGGTDVGTDRRIFLQASDGIVVPDVTTKTLADAQVSLTALGLRFATSERRHDGLVKGSVASQVPRPSQRIDASRQIVFLDIVGGRYVKVPDVNGKLLSDALAVIRSGELVPTETPANTSFGKTSVQEGRINCQTIRTSTAVVASTQPPAGSEIYPGLPVVVNFSVVTSDRNQRSMADECNPMRDSRPLCSKANAC